ncbi:MAG: flagellar motor protein MotB [Oligoflexus sp.]|nr:flagellar motor protein MotB [Oligoflexus sp.]
MKEGKRRAFKSKHVAESHDESWLVSYADMMTLLFGFFVILYSFSTIDDKKYERMSDEIASAFKSQEKSDIDKVQTDDLGEDVKKIRALRMVVSMLNLGTQEEAIAKIEKAYSKKEATQALADLSKQITEGGVPGRKGSDRTYIDLILSENALFQKGGYEVDPLAIPYLKGLAADINASPGVGEIMVAGHTDSVSPSATSYYKNNYVLSSLRAGMVADVLIRFGVDPHKVRVLGMGSLEPLLPEYNGEGKAIPQNMAKNRRVQITIRREATP